MARLGPMLTRNPFYPEQGKNVICCDDEEQARDVIRAWGERQKRPVVTVDREWYAAMVRAVRCCNEALQPGVPADLFRVDRAAMSKARKALAELSPVTEPDRWGHLPDTPGGCEPGLTPEEIDAATLTDATD